MTLLRKVVVVCLLTVNLVDLLGVCLCSNHTQYRWTLVYIHQWWAAAISQLCLTGFIWLYGRHRFDQHGHNP